MIKDTENLCPFSCLSVKAHSEICFRLFSGLTKPWVVWPLRVVTLHFAVYLYCCALFTLATPVFSSPHVYSVPPTSGPFRMLFTLPGIPFLPLFHPVKSPKNATQKLVSRRFLWYPWCESVRVCVCVCVCVCTSVGFVDGKSRERIVSPNTCISHFLCTFHNIYICFIAVLFLHLCH